MMGNAKKSKSYKFKVFGAMVVVTVDSSYDYDKQLIETTDYFRWLHYHAAHELFFVGDSPLSLMTEKGKEEYSDCALFVPSYLRHMAFVRHGHRILFAVENARGGGEFGDFADRLAGFDSAVALKITPAVSFYLERFGELFFSEAEGMVADEMAISLLKLIFGEIYRKNTAENYEDKRALSEESYLVKIDQIVGDYSRDINIAYVAEKLALSTRQTARIINKYYKTTLSELVNQQRLGVARRLLAESDMPISEIVGYVNFSSENYFCKKFKSVFGCTPLAFRKSSKNKQQANNKNETEETE